jgi:hypothetical protein
MQSFQYNGWLIFHTAVPLIQVGFPWFQLPVATCGLKILSRKFQQSKFVSFTLPTMLSCVMKPCIVPLCPVQDVSWFFIQHMHAICATCPLVTKLSSWLWDWLPGFNTDHVQVTLALFNGPANFHYSMLLQLLYLITSYCC